MHHVNTRTPEELKQLNIIASRSNISIKNVITFLNTTELDKRYQLIWGWLSDPYVDLKLKGFKTFIRNLKVRDINDWVSSTGERIFIHEVTCIENDIDFFSDLK